MHSELTLIINDVAYGGWMATRVNRSCEQFPSSFEISATEKDPSGQKIVFVPFQRCVIKLGADVVITGYIDDLLDHIDSNSHEIAIQGRSKCADLVDCSAEVRNDRDNIPLMTFGGADIQSLAQVLCDPYGITVTLNTKQELGPLPQFHINIGDTPYSIIERMARSQNLLMYDGPDGNLILSDLATETHSSGFALGHNIQSLTRELRYSQRYSEYDVFDSSANELSDLVQKPTYGKAVDATIRHRRLMGFSETPFVNQRDWAQRRANWELARSRGRSMVIRLRTDSYRDSSGKLWTPNTYVDVQAPGLRIDAKWVICDVAFAQDLQGGTYADLMLMPPEAFNVAPTSLLSLDAGLLPTGVDKPEASDEPEVGDKVKVSDVPANNSELPPRVVYDGSIPTMTIRPSR